MIVLKYLIKLLSEGDNQSFGLKTSESIKNFIDSLFSTDSGGKSFLYQYLGSLKKKRDP
jgi:hypothetical protein